MVQGWQIVPWDLEITTQAIPYLMIRYGYHCEGRHFTQGSIKRGSYKLLLLHLQQFLLYAGADQLVHL